MTDKVYMTVAEAAERLGVTGKTVTNWIERGLMPGSYRLNPDQPKSPYRIPVTAVERIERKRKGEA